MATIVLSRNDKEGHWQVLYDGDGPYLIGSTLDVPEEEVVRRIKRNNPGSTVSVEKPQ